MKGCSIYRLTPKEADALKEYISEHLRKGYIRPSKSPMACPFFFVDKKDGKLRPVQDYRTLNEITIKNAAPLPLIPELIDKLHGARYFTKLDIRWGYNNIRIRPGDEYKAAFKTSLGLFKPTVMPFGLCNAPATFQAMMNYIFGPEIDGSHVVVYLNDILIFTEDLASLSELTHAVLQRLEEHDLYLKPEKCVFAQTSVEYLGIVISNGQVSMDPAKVAGITEWPVPRTVKHSVFPARLIGRKPAEADTSEAGPGWAEEGPGGAQGSGFKIWKAAFTARGPGFRFWGRLLAGSATCCHPTTDSPLNAHIQTYSE